MNWNEVVGQEDTVFLLGDFAMGSVEKTLQVTRRLNGKKILIPGNHDRCWKGRPKNRNEWREKYLRAGFVAVIDEASIYADDWKLHLTLSHFPFRYEPDINSHGVDRADKFYQYRPVDDGQLLLCGHVHTGWKKKGRMLNVGVDVNGYYPISLEEALDLLDGPDIP